MSTQPARESTQEWERKLLIAISGMLLFETLTGLSIWLLPFSVSNQVMVLLHTAIGLVFIVPFAWYLIRHWLLYRPRQMTHIKLTGYFAMAATLAAIVSGLVLDVAGALLRRGSATGGIWSTSCPPSRLSHRCCRTWSSSSCGAARPGARSGRRPRSWRREAVRHGHAHRGGTPVRGRRAAGLGLRAAGAGQRTARGLQLRLRRRPALRSQPREDQHRRRPSTRARSAARRSCGTSGCHEEILKEWQVSAHRYSAMDVAFQTVQRVMAEQNGAESTRYCGGCHDPISLFSGRRTCSATT